MMPQSLTQGFVNNAWHAQPIIIGYSWPLRIVFSNINLPAGISNQLYATSVPSNELWILKTLGIGYVGTVAGVRVIPFIMTSGQEYFFDLFNSLVSGEYEAHSIEVIASSGDQVGMRVYNATLNDDLLFWITGFRMILNY